MNSVSGVQQLEINASSVNNYKGPIMARTTKAELETAIATLEIKLKMMSDKAVKLEQTLMKRDGVIVGKNNEILNLQKHIGFVHAQRDKLVGFVEGRESLTNPKIESEDSTYYQPLKPVLIDRVDKFISECNSPFMS